MIVDFHKTSPPRNCGYDETTGEDKFCCAYLDGQKIDIPPQPPQFPEKGWKARPCQDHITLCKKWVKSHPDSCTQDHKSFEFMKVACMESCGRCNGKVNFFYKLPSTIAFASI